MCHIHPQFCRWLYYFFKIDTSDSGGLHIHELRQHSPYFVITWPTNPFILGIKIWGGLSAASRPLGGYRTTTRCGTGRFLAFPRLTPHRTTKFYVLVVRNPQNHLPSAQFVLKSVDQVRLNQRPTSHQDRSKRHLKVVDRCCTCYQTFQKLCFT